MFVAVDKEENRIYADEYSGKQECFCPVCGRPVIAKKGPIRVDHFAHFRRGNCSYDLDGNSMSEWHIRMQGYFPKEQREVRFKDKNTGEPHIADVFIQETNTVLEFQHSPIREDEFLKRTLFHLKEGRRIAWFFDESSENPYRKHGKYERAVYRYRKGPYSEKEFRWPYKGGRLFQNAPSIDRDDYGIFVFTGTEGDVFHKIIHHDKGYNYITFSLHDTAMSPDLEIKELFYPEAYWQEQEPWKSALALLAEEEEAKRKAQEAAGKRQQGYGTYQNPYGYTKNSSQGFRGYPEGSEEYNRRYAEYEDVDERLKKYKENKKWCLRK